MTVNNENKGKNMKKYNISYHYQHRVFRGDNMKKYNISYHYGMDRTPHYKIYECGSNYTIEQAASMFACTHGGSFMVIDSIIKSEGGIAS